MNMRPLLTPADCSTGTWLPPVSWYQSRVLWREVGRRLSHHPEVLATARTYLEIALETGEHACSPQYLHRWRELIEQGIAAVVEVLTSVDDNEGQVLRSCSPAPFLSLISEQERNRLFDLVKWEVRALRHNEARAA